MCKWNIENWNRIPFAVAWSYWLPTRWATAALSIWNHIRFWEDGWWRWDETPLGIFFSEHLDTLLRLTWVFLLDPFGLTSWCFWAHKLCRRAQLQPRVVQGCVSCFWMFLDVFDWIQVFLECQSFKIHVGTPVCWRSTAVLFAGTSCVMGHCTTGDLSVRLKAAPTSAGAFNGGQEVLRIQDSRSWLDMDVSENRGIPPNHPF